MLQIIIIHEANTTKIFEIKRLDILTIVSQFDEQTNKIDLESLKPYIGQQALVTHFNKENDCTMFDYEHIKTITDVGQDENGIWYLQYN